MCHKLSPPTHKHSNPLIKPTQPKHHSHLIIQPTLSFHFSTSSCDISIRWWRSLSGSEWGQRRRRWRPAGRVPAEMCPHTSVPCSCLYTFQCTINCLEISLFKFFLNFWPQFLETSFCSNLLSKKNWNCYDFMKNTSKTLTI